MDSLNWYDIKAEKANAMLSRHSQLRRLANVLRLVEAVVVLVLVSRLSHTIPHAVKSSGGLLRDLSAMLFGPRFVFVLGNLIVAVLFAKSGQFSHKKLSLHDDLYDEFLRGSAEKKATTDDNNNDHEKVVSKSNFVRSKSEVFSPAGRAKRSSRVLRRSETEKFGNIGGDCKIVGDQYQKLAGGDNDNREIVKVEVEKKKKNKCLYPEDLMSGEEFRMKVEAFIARQQRFRSMEEEFSSDDVE